MKKIEQIVREEQNKIGAQELLMPTIQSAEIWKESGRYDGYGDEMLRIKDRQGREMLYGPTNEELITDIFRSSVKSYKSLPQILYHIQWKFRDEIRPRFGIMRCREFYMKDAYSFDVDENQAKQSYNKMFYSYLKTFSRLGLKAIPMAADTGPIGGDLSHEFIILAETGESQIYADKKIFEIDLKKYDVGFLSVDDENFAGGGDQIEYVVDTGGAVGPLSVTAELYYQAIGFRWADNLKNYQTTETERFVRYYGENSEHSAIRLAENSVVVAIK
jgi:prolyl-tRNA synthetase